MKKHKIVIDRSKWRTGGDGSNRTGIGRVVLKNEEGYKCCLGFMTEQLVPEADIFGACNPAQCASNVPCLVEDEQNLMIVNHAIKINDAYSITPTQKENALKELFGPTEIELEFI